MAINHKSPEFKKLQREWDKKLKESGFEDIEDRNSPLEFLKSWHATRFRANRDGYRSWQEDKEEYFYRAGQFLNWYAFKSESEREIWRRHSEGETLREIAAKKVGQKKFSKDGIHKIIRELQVVMLAWAVPDEPILESERIHIGISPRSRRRSG